MIVCAGKTGQLAADYSIRTSSEVMMGEVDYITKHYVKDMTPWPREDFLKPLTVNNLLTNKCFY